MILPSSKARSFRIAPAVVAAFALCPLGALAGCGGGDDEAAARTDGIRTVAKIAIDGQLSLSAGDEHTFVALAVYDDGSTRVLSAGDVVWNTSNAEVATVDEDGVVRALGEGMVHITVEHGGVLETRVLVVLS